MRVEMIAEVGSSGIEGDRVVEMISETTLLTVEGDPQWCQRFIAQMVAYAPTGTFRISDEDDFGERWTKDWNLSDTVSQP